MAWADPLKNGQVCLERGRCGGCFRARRGFRTWRWSGTLVTLLFLRFRLGKLSGRRRHLLLSFNLRFDSLCHRHGSPSARNTPRLLLRFGIGFPDALPQALQRVGAGLRTESFIRAESLHNGLDHLFLNTIGAGFPFPVIEHFGETADDGTIAVSVLMFETEEFA